MLNRPGRSPFAVSLALMSALAAGSLAGCGGDDLSDEAYGALDLAPYYFDGATPSNPTQGIPRDIRPSKGWVNGLRAEYYDFGLVSASSKRTVSGGTTGVPDVATAHPMYFLFNSAGKPLFSSPILEKRTGQWHMRGGDNLLNPNPTANAKKTVPYSVRVRTYVSDSVRTSTSYQRPIIDRLQIDSNYSGLWEVVEVVATGDYKPDAIKSYFTLKKAIDAGKFRVNRTQKVINCPVIDDRSYVWPSAMAYGVPHPRIELWYRTKLGSCFLANGWETLGDANNKPFLAAVKGKEAAGNDRRLDTFDVVRFTIGSGDRTFITVQAPVGKIYTPMVRLLNQNPTSVNFDIRYANEDLSDSLPRRTPADPPGYRPIRWLTDIKIAQDPPFEPGTFKNVPDVDPALFATRGTLVRNTPVIGRAITCTPGDNTPCQDFRLECNEFPDENIMTSDPPPGKSVKDMIQIREGGPRCDAPARGYGEFCAPGIGRCNAKVSGIDEAIIKSPPMPGVAGSALDNGVLKPSGGGLGLPSPNPSSGGFGYTCHPAQTGFCYIRCDGDASNSLSGAAALTAEVPLSVTLPMQLGGGKSKTTSKLALDSRCGGIAMPGYSCLGPTTTPATPSKLRVCARACNGNDPTNVQDAVCALPWSPSVANAGAAGSTVDGRDISKGQTCQNKNGITACIWDPAFYPRDLTTTGWAD